MHWRSDYSPYLAACFSPKGFVSSSHRACHFEKGISVSTTINWEGLKQPSRRFHLVACSRTALGQLLSETPRGSGLVLRTIRGDNCTTAQELFLEWAQALELPPYFGQTWEALEECLNDTAWFPAKTYVLVIENADAILRNSRTDLPSLASVLSRVFPRTEPRRLHVVFHCLENRERQTRTLLQQGGISF